MALTVLSEADVTEILSAELAIRTQADAYRAVVNGAGRLASAIATHDRKTGQLAFVLTGAINGHTGTAFKVGVEQVANARRGLPTVQGVVLLADPETGMPLACVHGGSISVLKSSAGLAVAARELAPAGAHALGVLGSGRQAAAAIRMIACVRKLDAVAIWSPTPANRERLGEVLRHELGIDVRAFDNPRAVVERSEIVATCTASRKPILAGEWLRPGHTVLTLGCNEAGRSEIDLAATIAARTFVDDLGQGEVRCGPVIEAVEAGKLRLEEVTEIGDVLEGRRPGRVEDEAVVLFHSMGIGYQDAAAAWAVYERAAEFERGEVVEF